MSASHWNARTDALVSAPVIVAAHTAAIVFAMGGYPDLASAGMLFHLGPISLATLHFMAIHLALPPAALIQRTLHQGPVLHVAVFSLRIDGLTYRSGRNGASRKSNQ
ncbi:hypothetical protein E5CHR_01373 [Variovorax sp. PBL-E5]|nr:hypothetical protein E5CHR_01373 [Variovorax sp. PBL-E5]